MKCYICDNRVGYFYTFTHIYNASSNAYYYQHVQCL